LQKSLYKSSFSHNHDLSIAGGTDKTKILFAANYMDEQGMKLMSYAKRASAIFKIDQKLHENLNFNVDLRYTDRRSLGSEGTTSGAGSILSSSYRFRPIAIADIKGDLSYLTHSSLREENTVLYDVTDCSNRTLNNDNLALEQSLLGTAGLNWNILNNLPYRTELTLSRSYTTDKNWEGPTVDPNYYIATGTMETMDKIIYAGNADLRKRDKWGLRWTNTLNYDILQSDTHRLNVLDGQEITNSGGSDMRIDAMRFPANFTKDNAFAMINQYDTSVSTNLVVSSG